MSDPVSAANALSSALETLREELAESNARANARLDAQKAYGRRNRRLIWATITSLVLGFALTIALIFTVVQLNDTTAKADRNRERQISTCLSTNEARANNRKLWDFLLKLPPNQEQTSQQRQQLEAFKSLVVQTFAPRDCSKI